MMSVIRQWAMPQHYWKQFYLLSVSIVLLGLMITMSLSHYETERRLNVFEFEHKMVVEEMSRVSDTSKKTQLVQNELLRLNGQRQHRIHVSSLESANKIITELKQIKNERPDFALGTAGAAILSTGRTQVMMTPLPQWLSMFGFRGISKYFLNGAHRVIQPSVQPGECFAFHGPGEVIIKLIRTVFIDAVAIEHIPPQISPDGNISSAPGCFDVYGMENTNDRSPVQLGTFRYDIEKNQSLQEFQLPSNSSDKSFPIVKFEFAPKPDDLNYTCVYRVRVHGSLIKPN